MKVQRNIPLHIKVADALRESIRDQYLLIGQIPNENDLADEIGVSRGTIRQALSTLADEGLILRKQGVGTFINPHVMQMNVRADLPFRFTELINNAGYTASITLLEHQNILADDDLSSTLSVPLRTEVMLLKRVFLANDKPAIYVIDHLPLKMLCHDFTEDDLKYFLFQFLEKYCNIKVKYTLSTLNPINADQTISQVLNIPIGSALLMCNDRHYCEENQLRVLSTVFYKDEIIRFTTLRNNFS